MIGERIKQARMQREISQGALAGLVGVAQPTVSQYERGVAVPSTDTLSSLARVLRVSFEWLATGRGEMDFRYGTSVHALATHEPPPPDEQELLTLYRALPAARRDALLEFIKRWK